MNKKFKLNEIQSKSVVLGLSYFDVNNQLLKQKQLMGHVINVGEEDSITLELADNKHFILPGDLSPWFIAPKGRYYNQEFGVDIENPDYLVTWDVYQKQNSVNDKQHQWWDWIPRMTPPEVHSAK